ncbi:MULTISPECIES: hypothetical protein [Enterobacteriaceae]|uniref:hypothetical protein n=1 Tax=Enterobacteriaceae TaxID=543 RepID=UPI000272B7C7|nr:hypothetical protein [Enterobacter sp. Ag1]EJF31398.1 hypothetical protein A936_09481 [Enterobacter sp. Ag1]
MLNINLKKFGEKLDKNKIARFRDEYLNKKYSELETKRILDGWRRRTDINGDLKIIHTVSSVCSMSRAGRNVISPFEQRSAVSILNSWDVISCCCIAKKIPARLAGCGGAPLAITLDLNVPVQNILGTHLQDVSFPNFAGREGAVPSGALVDSYALADAIFQGKNRPNKHNFIMNKPYNTLLSVEEIHHHMMRQQTAANYNEIIVVGRTGLNMYSGLPATDIIRLNGISYRPFYAGIEDLLSSGQIGPQLIEMVLGDLEFIKKLLRVNNLKEFTCCWSKRGLLRVNPLNQVIINAGFEQSSHSPEIFKLSNYSFA